MPVVMYGCETSMIKQRLRMLDESSSGEYLKFRVKNGRSLEIL
jgi:hypothetical protein